MDLFRCESATLRTHWVLVVMDQYTRRIIGFGVHAGTVDAAASLCRMFNRAIRGQRLMPRYLSSDNDPLYRFHQWQANLRILEVTEIKSVPYVPLSHPFVERLIGTVRREYLDHILFGLRQISKTSCSISGPTLTTIGRMTLWKDERRIRPCLDQSQISARSVGNPTVAPCTRRRWPPDLSESRPGCSIRSTSASFTVFQSQSTFPIRSLPCHQVRSESETQLTLVKQVKSARVTIRQTHAILPSISCTRSCTQNRAASNSYRTFIGSIQTAAFGLAQRVSNHRSSSELRTPMG